MRVILQWFGVGFAMILIVTHLLISFAFLLDFLQITQDIRKSRPLLRLVLGTQLNYFSQVRVV